jgi:hypothetical protein
VGAKVTACLVTHHSAAEMYHPQHSTTANAQWCWHVTLLLYVLQ